MSIDDDLPASAYVGIFWFVDEALVTVGCPVTDASSYGDCLTFEGGHAQYWEQWQGAGCAWLVANDLPARILSTEYDDHPRGRIVKTPSGFVLYADRRLQTPARLDKICLRFGLHRASVLIRNDAHYRDRAWRG